MLDIFKRIKELTVRENDMVISDRTTKLGEEFGELCEAVLVHTGKLPHKKVKEPPEGEIVDVSMIGIDILFRLYPDATPEKLYEVYLEWMNTKLDKWEKQLGKRNK